MTPAWTSYFLVMASRLHISQAQAYVKGEEEFGVSEWDELKADFAFLYSVKLEQTSKLFARPTRTELQACWELCRLQNGMGCVTVFLPMAWAAAMVYHAQPTLSAFDALTRLAFYLALSVCIKSIIMTIDDILDYDIDSKVERTKARALPRGAISLNRAWLLFSLQSIIGAATEIQFLARYALYASMAAWPLYIIYPTCKRWTSFAPIPLGLMFNIGLFIGWADLSTATTPFSPALIPMYIGATMWTITYETVYQHQDRLEDVQYGMKSLAIFLGESTISVCTATALSFGALMMFGGYLNGHGISFYTSIALATAVLLRGLKKTDINDPVKCMQFFLLTPLVGQVVLSGLVLDVVLGRLTNGMPL